MTFVRQEWGRMKEACGNELAILGTHFKFKKNIEEKLVAANGDL